MVPAYRVRIDGADITAVLQERLLTLAVRDESGYHSDTATVSIDDQEGRVALPRRGVRMDVEMGYRRDRATPAGQGPVESERPGLVSMGSYTVDEVVVSGPPRTIVIRARAIDFRDTLKQPKTRAWEGTIGTMVSRIAAEHSLRPRVHADLAGISVPHIDQTEESDLAFLTRLGRRYDAVAKPAGRDLPFVPLGRGTSATGTSTTARIVRPGQVSDYRCSLVDRPRFQSVVAYWRDVAQGSQESVRMGSGEPADTLRRPYPTEAEARAAATARLQSLTRDGSTLTLTLHPGDPLIFAGSRLTVTGFRTGMDGAWIVAKSTHSYRNHSGYATRLEAHRPTSVLASD